MPPVAMIAVAAFGAISAGAAIAGAIGVTAFLGMSVATWAAIGAVGMLVSGLALAATMPKPKTPESAGQQLNMKLSADNALPVAYGRTATGGSIYYRDTSGRSNKTLAMLVALSVGGAIGGVSEVRANDYQLSLSGAYSGGKQTTIAAIGDTASKSKMFKKNSLHFWHLNGADPQPQTFAQVSGLPIPADRASGVATAIIQADYDQEVFPQGLPKFTWVVNGQRVYDPRKDSTYPGGSGSHRIDNPATWEWSQNPHLCALNWTLGRWSGGKKLFGIGAPPEEVDIPAFVAGANIADALGWTVGGVAQTTDDKFAVLGTLLQAGGAIPLVRGAQISVLTYTVKPSIYTITKDDVVGSASVMNTAPHRDRKNRITPTYREESQFWNLVPGEAVSAAQYVAEDSGEVRSSEINLPFVQKASQAHQLATYDLVNTREFLTFEITAKPKLLAVRVGDCVTVTLPDIAVNNQKCMVVQRDFDPNTFQVKLTLRSETDAKHAFALGQSQVAPPSPSLSTFDPSNPDGPGEGSWVISDTSILNDAGAQQPALVVSGANDDPTTQAVIVEIRRSGETEWTAPREGPSSSTQFIVTDVVADTDYEVAVSYRTVLGIVSERMVIGPVTAGAQLAGGVRPGGIGWNPNDPNSPIIGVPPVLTDLDENGHIDGGMVNAGDGLTVLERFTAFGEELAAANETIANAQAMVDGVPGQIAAVADQAEADLAAARTNLQGQIDGIPALITAGDATLQSAIADANTTINTNRTNAETAIAEVNSQITLVNPAAGTLGRRFITAETMTASTVTKVSALETVVGTSANEAGTLRGRVYNLEQSSSEGSTVTAQRIAGLEASVGLNANEGLRARMATVEVATTDGRFATSSRVNDLEARLGAGNGTSVTARLTTVETATTDGRFATASRVSALEATVNNPTGGVANLGARMATVETATTDGRFATSTRVSTLEATVNAADGGNANLKARLGVVETATTDGRFATASRVATLEATVNTGPNSNAQLAARLVTVETATTDGRFATAQRVQNLEATVNAADGGNANLKARLGTVETATTDGRFATATRVTALEAANRSSANLIKNPDFKNGFSHWERDGAGPASDSGFYYHATLGSIAWIKGAVGYMCSEFYPCSPGDVFSFSFEGDAGGGNGNASLQWLPGYAQVGHVNIPSTWGVRAKSENITAPAGTTGVRIVIGKGNATQIHATRVKLNYGPVATNYSDEATDYDTNARLGVVETATTDGRFATASRVTDLEATVNTGPNRNGQLAARITLVETATTDGRFATASRVQSLEAAVGAGNGTPVTSRITTVETATTDGRFASATRVGLLEARGTDAINRNGNFAVDFGNGAIPSGWSDWSGAANNTTRVNGVASNNAVRFTTAAGQDRGISQTVQSISTGWYVLEGTVTLESGSLLGSGILVQFFNSGGTEIDNAQLRFAEQPDISGNVQGAGSAGKTYRYSFLKNASAAGITQANIYAMAGWSGFGTIAAKTMTFHEAKIRQASSAEIAVGVATPAGSNLNARIGLIETATTDGRFATAQRASDLEATVNTGPNRNGQLAARITVVETATTDGRFATSTRVNDLQATLQTRNNLCPNGGLENQLVGMTSSHTLAYANVGWGPCAMVYNSGSATVEINFPRFSVYGSNYYTISGDTVCFGSSGQVAYLDIIFFDANGAVCADGPEKPIYGQHDFTNGTGRLQDHAIHTLAPSNAVQAQARAVFHGNGITVCGVRRVKVEMGQTPATPYTPEASGVQTSARLTTVETATTDGRFATASSVTSLTARVNSQGGNLLINTDFESGTGGWSPGGQVVAPLVVNPAGDPWHPVGENVVGFNVVGSAGYSDIFSDRVSVEGGKWYDLSAYIAAHRANVNMYIGWFNAAGANLGYPDGPGEFVPASGGQSLNQFTRRWFKAQAPSDAAFAIVIFRKLATNSGGDSWLWLCRPMFGECSASTTEPRPFTHGNARNLAGQILSANNVTADLRGRVQATAGLTVQAGNRVAGMRFHATDGTDQNYSSIDFLADTFRVWSPDQNTGIPPFEVRNGGVRMKSAFVDRLSVGTSITLGSGIQFKVAVQPIDINVTDGQSINFGYDLGANPSLTFAGNNLAPLNAGETYNLYAENLSPTGFIARLKISTPASPANLATGWLGANANGPTTHHMYIDQYGGRSTTGGYNVRVNGYNRIYKNRFNKYDDPYYMPDDPNDQLQGETWITVYGWNGGAWVEIDTIWIGPNWTSANGYQDQYFDVTQTVPTGTNISHIGVAVTYKTYAESYVGSLAVDWQTQGSGGGLRSATPNGQVSAVTIRPKS